MVSVEIMQRPDFRRRHEAALFLCAKGKRDERIRRFCNKKTGGILLVRTAGRLPEFFGNMPQMEPGGPENPDAD